MLIKYLPWMKLGAVVALFFALAVYHHHVFEQGVAQELARRDKIDADNTIKAQKELAVLNKKVRAAQADLTKAIAGLEMKQTELQNEQATSTARQSALLAGTERMRVLVAQHRADQAGHASSSATATVDQGTEVIEDLAPTVAAGIERIRSNENSAIDRLDACIVAYDAVKAASDKTEHDDTTELRK